MEKIVQYECGSPDVLERQEIDKPVIKDDEVLVRVHWHAADYRSGDCAQWQGSGRSRGCRSRNRAFWQRGG